MSPFKLSTSEGRALAPDWLDWWWQICEISGSQTRILHLVVRDLIEWTAPSLCSYDTDIALSTLCLNSVPFLVMGIIHYIGHPFSVAVRQYWWLLLCRQPTLLTKANDLSTGCSWSGWSPAGCTTFFTCVRCKFLFESVKSHFFRGIWLLTLVKLRNLNIFFPLSRGWRSVFILFHLCQLTE